jgi:ferredoxin-like protein FixX
MNQYVYVYLDPRKPGEYIYDDLKFDYEPFYVGQGKNNRCFDGLRSGCSNYKKNKINKIIREGFQPISIKIFENLLYEDAIRIEIEIISKIGRSDLKKGPLVNLTDGGEGTANVSDETKQKRAQKQIGRKCSDKTKEKMRLSRKEYFDKGNTTWNKGREWTAEERLKLTNKSFLNREFSEEHRKKISNNSKKQMLEGRSVIKLRPILQYTMNDEFIKEYDSVLSASIQTNIKSNTICNCCRKISKSSGGFKWRYKLESKSIKYRPILQYTMNDEFIKEYDSILSATTETGIIGCAIVNCCGKFSKSSGGFKWYYKNNN